MTALNTNQLSFGIQSNGCFGYKPVACIYSVLKLFTGLLNAAFNDW
ncbi:hypothetical protein Solca_0267 [Solitalea canadensis DSM 3403]|uniref:Uncharacterized protein n=1 Tax=Solitalea canadensis (strain ATCC 29591 / DSM 3403 / JCM 21819 / LMG 8368 / NBRC 15130 / NCIMB 12057 / USAM 9D) TaxID=929556 RepID=H8KSV1_SOLCM|nr:hypothetical protein Solca_0267 [Solitalea canadensis DSM 3403]